MLSPEDAEKVLTKNLANVIRKANAGKTLTAAERALLEQSAAGGTLNGSSSAFAKTWDDLAQRLGVSRKTLQNVQKRKLEGQPRPRADGRHDVAAWSRFFVVHNIARTAEDLPTHEAVAAGAPESVTDWKAEKLKLECDKISLEVAKTAGELVSATDVEAGVSAMVAAFRQALNNLPARVAQEGLEISDYHELEELVQNEVNLVLRSLERADFVRSQGAAGDTLRTASPVVTDPAATIQVLPDQRPASKAKKKFPAKGKVKGGAVGRKGKKS